MLESGRQDQERGRTSASAAMNLALRSNPQGKTLQSETPPDGTGGNLPPLQKVWVRYWASAAGSIPPRAGGSCPQAREAQRSLILMGLNPSSVSLALGDTSCSPASLALATAEVAPTCSVP